MNWKKFADELPENGSYILMRRVNHTFTYRGKRRNTCILLVPPIKKVIWIEISELLDHLWVYEADLSKEPTEEKMIHKIDKKALLADVINSITALNKHANFCDLDLIVYLYETYQEEHGETEVSYKSLMSFLDENLDEMGVGWNDEDGKNDHQIS